MKRNFYAVFVAVMSAFTFVGCTSEEDVTDGGMTKQLSFSAVVDGGSVRGHASERMKTQLHPNDNNSVTFCKDDAISVFDGTTLQNKRFATNESGASVTFSGAAPESTTYTALYPYQEGATISGSTISAVLPTTQYAQAGTTFDPKAVLSVATTTSEAMAFAFKNVCSLVKFTTKEPLAKIVFKGNNGEKVAGNVSIAVSATPTATGEATSITLLPLSPATTIAADNTYYISVLPQAFANGFTLEAYKTSSSATADYAFNTNTAVSLVRSQILNIGELKSASSVNANGHEYVDLGVVMPDGTKVLWATMNVGANAVTDRGNYYAWGETETKTDYSWSTYKFGRLYNINKYNASDGRTELYTEDDVAHVKWGGDWKIPTQAEWQALCNQTTNEYVSNYLGITNLYGRIFKSKSNPERSIFIPCAGYYDGTTLYSKELGADYWSSTLVPVTSYPDANVAYNLDFAYDGVYPNYTYRRCVGQPVRPVLLQNP